MRSTAAVTATTTAVAALTATGLLIGAAPAAAQVRDLRLVTTCTESDPHATLTFTSDGTVANVRRNGVLELAVPPGPGPVSIRVGQVFGAAPYELVDAAGATVAQVAALPTRCDGFASLADYVGSGAADPAHPLAIGPLTGPAERTPQGIDVHRGANGALYTDPAAPADPQARGHVVKGAIHAYYRARGELAGPLGPPRGSEAAVRTGEGFLTRFTGGTAYWSPEGGVRTVKGAIREAYQRRDAERSGLGLPTSEEFGPLRSGGYGQHFRDGSIYWTPTGGGWTVRGALRDLYARTGWERGPLGYPLGEERAWGRNPGTVVQDFEGGTAVSNPTTGTTWVQGALGAKWTALGGPDSMLGTPTGPEFGPLRGGGYGQHFQHGSLYWSPATGAHAVTSLVREWAAAGWENGYMGYPVADADGLYGGTSAGAGFRQQFQGASLYQFRGGLRTVRGAILAEHRRWGAETGVLGYPLGNEEAVPGGARQAFDGGTITWTPAGGAVVRLRSTLSHPAAG